MKYDEKELLAKAKRPGEIAPKLHQLYQGKIEVLPRCLVKELSKEANPLKILAKLKTNIALEFFKEPIAESSAETAGPREVILSEYLMSR